jgi:hypothetical protein
VFLSPSVVHFTTVFVACLIAIAPLPNRFEVAALVSGDGLFGLVYAGAVWRRMARYGFIAKLDFEDRLWYAALPTIGYAIVLGAGASFLLEMGIAPGVLALAMGALLLVGIRNAWDITAWMVIGRQD